MTDIFIAILATLGAIFILIAALGVYRMPDFYTRLSVTVKASTLGVGCLLISSAFYFNDFQTTSKIIAIIFFLFITAPIAGHMISRAAYISGIKMWSHNDLVHSDDLRGKYDAENNVLRSHRNQDTEEILAKQKQEIQEEEKGNKKVENPIKRSDEINFEEPHTKA